MKLRNILVFLFLLIFSGTGLKSYSQAVKTESLRIGFGGAVIYNFHSAGFGGDLRLKIPITKRVSFVPEFDYFPAFNDYHEFYAGAALHLEVATIGTYNLYLLGAGYFNKWINAEEFAPGHKKENNFVPELGMGLVRNHGCVRPFIEDRYDFKWKENSLRIGVYIYLGSCQGKEPCPAYD